MKKTKVELPNGNLLTIEGGDSEAMAKLLTNHYLRQDPVANTEDALPVPGLGSQTDPDKPRRQLEPAEIIRNVPPQHVENAGEEEALELPVMNFGK